MFDISEERKEEKEALRGKGGKRNKLMAFRTWKWQIGNLYLSCVQLLWKYLQPQRKYIVAALLFARLSQVLSMIDPIIFGKIIDRYAKPSFNFPGILSSTQPVLVSFGDELWTENE